MLNLCFTTGSVLVSLLYYEGQFVHGIAGRVTNTGIASWSSVQEQLVIAVENPAASLSQLMTEAGEFAVARRRDVGAWFAGAGRYARHQKVTASMAQQAIAIARGDMRIPHFAGVTDPRAIRDQMMHTKIVEAKATVLRALSGRLGKGLRDALRP